MGAVGNMAVGAVGNMINLTTQENEFRNYRLKKVDVLMRRFKETILNQEFINPYIKNVDALFHYQKAMQKFKGSSFEQKCEFFKEISEVIRQLKRAIFFDNQFQKVERLLPLMHILIYFLTYYGLVEHKLPLE